MTDTVDDFLAHYGVKGMKWGVRRDSSSDTIGQKIGLTKKGTKPLDKQGNLKRPSYGRAALVGPWANSHARYTNPAARTQRTKAGQLFAASLVSGIASNAVTNLGGNSSGAKAVAALLGTASSVTALGGTVYGVASVRNERKSRSDN